MPGESADASREPRRFQSFRAYPSAWRRVCYACEGGQRMVIQLQWGKASRKELEMATMPASEFGGRAGLVQRAEDGHELTASEKLMLMKHTGQDPEGDPDNRARGTGRAFQEGVTETERRD